MISRANYAFIFWSAAAGIFAPGSGVQANDLHSGGAEHSFAEAQCAVLGPGFTAVEGSDACVWTGGHVRVEFGSRGTGSSDNGWAAGSVAPLRVNDNGDHSDEAGVRGHLRLRDSDVTGSIDPFGR
jgi:hypothetical protein